MFCSLLEVSFTCIKHKTHIYNNSLLSESLSPEDDMAPSAAMYHHTLSAGSTNNTS